MSLTRLQAENIRNLRRVRLQGFQAVNLFFGANGSGKTSLLEAIHLLGMARSFRGASVKSLITHGEDHCTVFGTVSEQSGAALPLGVQRGRTGEAQIRVGGRPVRVVAELAEQLPLQVITADGFGLLTGSPLARRQYLDWGVFHVEHRFFGQWQRFQRSIKQRNMLLRHGKIDAQELRAWTQDVAKAGAAITAYRKAYFEQLAPRFAALMAELAPGIKGLELQFRQGWDRDLDYADALRQGLEADREQGYTHSGPQRADIRVLTDGHLAADTLSRGQQKLVVCGLRLSQGQIMSEHGDRRCTYLVDDLPAELDREHSRRVCELLAGMGAQVFITCVEKEDILSVWPRGVEMALFHVEQGGITPAAAAEASA